MAPHEPNWAGRLVDFADGELSAADARAVGLHVRACPACADTLRRLRRSLSLAQQCWAHDAPRVPPRRRLHGALRMLASAAVAAGILVALAMPAAPRIARPSAGETGAALRAQIERVALGEQFLAAANLLAEAPGGTAVACERFRYIGLRFEDLAVGAVARARSADLCDER